MRKKQNVNPGDLISNKDSESFRFWRDYTGSVVFHVTGKEAVLQDVGFGPNYKGVFLHVTDTKGVRHVWPQEVAVGE